jgi:transcriptional regulator with XRE-family HTH domain
MATPSEVVGRRVQEARKHRGWSREELAARTRELGAEVSPASVFNLETGRTVGRAGRRRAVSVDELMVLAAALEVAPLFLTTARTDDSELFEVAPKLVIRTELARRWIRGDTPLPGSSRRAYHDEAPEDWGVELTPAEYDGLVKRLTELEAAVKGETRGGR